jgi:hypothetical protein
MPTVKIVLAHPHIEIEDRSIEYCCAYRFTEPVGAVLDGEVGYEPGAGATQAEILHQLKQMAVDHANLQTEDALGFTVDDVITWEM